MLTRITKLQIRNGLQLEVAFDDGTSGVADLSRAVDQGGVFAALRNADEFAKATIGGDGRYVEWPCGVDLCADALKQEIAANQRVA